MQVILYNVKSKHSPLSMYLNNNHCVTIEFPAPNFCQGFITPFPRLSK